jgi:hypothetical protein
MSRHIALALLASFAIARSIETRKSRTGKRPGAARPCL